MATKKNDVLDLSNLQVQEEPVKMELNHPQTGEVLHDAELGDFYIMLHGSDSRHYRGLINAQSNNRLLKAQRSGRAQTQTAEQIEAQATTLLAGCTVGWNLRMDGKALEFSTEKAKELYSNPAYAWIREQVDSFIHQRQNFLKG